MPFDRRFRKFDAIEVDARKAADPRPESYQPNVDSITVVDNLPAAPSIGSVRTTGEEPYPRTRFVLSYTWQGYQPWSVTCPSIRMNAHRYKREDNVSFRTPCWESRR
jgi:hypothetical protein